jgi:hypothetical protein
MKYKPDWEQARERMVAYWNHAVIDRCCIAIHAPKDDSTLVHPDIQNGPWLLELDEIPDSNTATIENWWTDPEWNYRRAITWFENTYFAGEALPVTYINWGASSMAAMFGSPPHFNKSSVWYPKVIEDWDTWRWEPNPEATPIWKAILAILDRLVEGAPGNYLVGKPELGNGADILSLIRGMDDLALDLINYPERVIDGVEMISSAWVRLMEEAHARVQPVNCGGDVLAWMGLWAPGKLDQLACDFSSVISPRMFRQFFVPEIVKMGGWCDYGVYHLDGPACIQHMLETLLTIPQIKAIQFTPGAGSPPTYTEAYLPRYRQILESGRNLYLLVQPGEVEKILASLPPEGLFMRTYVNTQEEADTMLKNVNKWSARKNKAVV